MKTQIAATACVAVIVAVSVYCGRLIGLSEERQYVFSVVDRTQFHTCELSSEPCALVSRSDLLELYRKAFSAGKEQGLDWHQGWPMPWLSKEFQRRGS